MRPPKFPLSWVGLLLITALAAALRLVDLGAVRLDPFYDAAVRSMGVSWHNFFFGAYEPGGSVSIDKPPVDLWLQVASVKLFGWGSTSLKLPEALAGTLSVPLLYAAIKRPFGAIAGLAAALALAVLPIEVITARSDTMDAVMMLLLVLALLMVVRACETGKTAWLLAGAAMLGVAFNVKLLESVVALPGLFLLAWLGLPRTSEDKRGIELARRATKFAAAAAVYVLVALSWLGATLLFPAHERPYAIGSTNGSAWNAAFVFNGSERLSGKTAEVGTPAAPHGHGNGELASTGTPITPPSPTRLLARGGQLPAKWLGWEALAALLLGTAVVISVLRGKAERIQRATAIGVFVWLLTGLVLFSAMARLHPRYVESFTPAVAAMFGIGVGLVAGLHSRARLLALPLTALLAIPLLASVEAVEAKTSDAGNVGALNPNEQRALSAYLLAHQGRARYELAAGSSTSVASLIVQDQRPVLMLTTYNGIPFTSVAQLKASIARGEVRYAFLDSVCTQASPKTTAGVPRPRCGYAATQPISHAGRACAGACCGNCQVRCPARACGASASYALPNRRAPGSARGSSVSTVDATASMRILVVDDEAPLRDTLTRSFSKEGHTVEAVATGTEAIERAGGEQFDVVLLDVALGAGPNGYDVCRTLREQRNIVPIIMLTALDTEADAVQGLEAGADDYVTKPFGLAELRSRIRAVLRRSGPRAMGREVLSIGPVTLDRSHREATISGEQVKLTFSEFELLAQLMSEPGRLFNRQELLRAIWGDSAYRDPRAIDVHIRHLREKVEERPEEPKLILTVRGAGYRFQEP